MPLRVEERPYANGTRTLWIIGTVTPAGEKVGIRIRRRAGSDNRATAEEEAVALERQVLRDYHLGTKPAERDFAAAVTSYLKADDRSAGTVREVDRWLKHFRTARLSLIDQDAVDQARDSADLISPDATGATWRKRVAILAAILNHAADRKWCDHVKFRLPSVTPGRTEFLLPEQYEAVETAAAGHIRPLLRFLVCTGARLGETLLLDWSQVDLRGARVNVWADQTKGTKRRIIDLPPAAILALAAIKHRKGRVFLNADGEAYPSSDDGGGQIKHYWAQACQRAGLPGQALEYVAKRPPLVRQFRDGRKRVNPVTKRFAPDVTPHDLRHTFASWHYALNRDLLALKIAGGWSSVTLVERYAHLLPAGHESGIRRVWGVGEPYALEARG